MKDLITIYTGGHPYTLDDLEHIQAGVRDLFKGMGLAIGGGVDPIILYGGKVYESGGNSHVTQGLALVDSELMVIAAATVSGLFGSTIELQLLETFEAPSPVTYEDLNNRNVHRNRYIALGRNNARPGTFVSAINPFTVKRARGSWTTPTLGTNWIQKDANAQGGDVQYMLDYHTNTLHLRGCTHWVTGNQPGSGVLFNLPVGMRPATKQMRAIFGSSNLNGAGFVVNDKTYVLIDTNGDVILDTNLTASVAYRLDGVSIILE